MRALDDPGIKFPPGSGIKYAGPPTSSPSVITIPGVTQPENPPEQEQNGTSGWVILVSIAISIRSERGKFVSVSMVVDERAIR